MAADYQRLQQHLGVFLFDEAHHAGASEAQELLAKIFAQLGDHFLLGTTPIPEHYQSSIQELFHHKAYWAYLDNFESYVASSSSSFSNSAAYRGIDQVLLQLEQAIEAGHAPPITDFELITPTNRMQSDLFIT